MKRKIDVAKDDADQFARLGGTWRTSLALDPGTGSSGWALAVDGRLYSGQGDPEDVVDTVQDILTEEGIRTIDILVVEDPFFIRIGNQWKLAWCAGLMSGVFRHRRRRDGVFWRPKPSTWRAVLGLNVSDEVDANGKNRKDREAVERAVHVWCRERTKLSLTTPSGTIQADRCMAIGMLYAAHRLARGTSRA